MTKQTTINRIRRDYPICEVDHSIQGYDTDFMDEPEEYDREEDVPDWERVD